MKYTIRPKKHELEQTRDKIRKIIQSYNYKLDLQDLNIDLGWDSNAENAKCFSQKDNTLRIEIGTRSTNIDLEDKILRAILEIEFLDKTDYSDISYHWQELAMMSYVKAKKSEIDGEEILSDQKIDFEWSELREIIDENSEDDNKILFSNAGVLADIIGKSFSESKSVESITEADKDDIIKAVDKFFK